MRNINWRTVRRTGFDYMQLTIGAALLALNIALLLVPNKIVSGGATGLALAQIRLALRATTGGYLISFRTGPDLNTATNLETWSRQVLASGIVTFPSVTMPSLISGDMYWVIAQNFQLNVNNPGGWFLNNQGHLGVYGHSGNPADSFGRPADTPLVPQKHPYFGQFNKPEWLGARTTLQRWYSDPVGAGYVAARHLDRSRPLWVSTMDTSRTPLAGQKCLSTPDNCPRAGSG